jgi:putative endonuclease
VKCYWVYIAASRSRVLYTGITNDIDRRMWEHKIKENPKSFASQYNCNRLVYCEDHDDVNQAIRREKQIKGWNRARKIKLIESMNPDWKDLTSDLVPIPHPGPSLRSG